MPSSSFSDPSVPPTGGHPFSVTSSAPPPHKTTGDSPDRSTMMYPVYGGGLYHHDGINNSSQHQHQHHPPPPYPGAPPQHHHQPGMYNFLYSPPPYGAYNSAVPGRPPPSAWPMQYESGGNINGGPYQHHRLGMASGSSNTIGGGVTSNHPTSDVNGTEQAEKHSDSSQSSKSAEEEFPEVKPIQTDFHCFVLQWKDKLCTEAEAEVDASLQGHDEAYKAKYRLYLVNSNLNCRLMKKWEDFTMEEREDYFQKEEDDRRRFMTEDEVISRHCFTLTARVRSPTKRNPEEELGEKRPQPEPSPTTDEETPPKKNRTKDTR